VYAFGRSVTTGWPVDPLPLAAFVGALAAVLVTYVMGASFGGTGLTLVLAGVAVATLATAVQQFVLLRHSDVIKEVYSWLSGRVSTATWGDVRLVTPYVLAAAVVLLLHRRHLDVLRVGDEEASTLGSEVRRVRLVVVIAATLGTAAVVSVSGLIGFVGIMVPHLVRLVAGSSYRMVLPLSIIVGAAFLILADIPGRVIEHGGETPIGVVTALLGAPMFIFVLRTRRAVA
jgi:iron complex transport system permease protein